jgi:hypothetical protein
MRIGWLIPATVLSIACGNSAHPPPLAKNSANALPAASKNSPARNPKGTPGKTFIIFADVTRSMTSEEQTSVRDQVQQVIDILPPQSHLYVFPLLEDVQRAGAFFSGELPVVETTSDDVDVQQLRAKWKTTLADKLKAINAGPPTGRQHTCISGALRKAEEITVDPAVAANTEIVIVSDMLEDCKDSLLGGPLTLEKKSIAKELKAAAAMQHTTRSPNLYGAAVTLLLSTGATSQPVVNRPPAEDLKTFWRLVLDRCGDRKEDYRFGTVLPQRLKDLKPKEHDSF